MTRAALLAILLLPAAALAEPYLFVTGAQVRSHGAPSHAESDAALTTSGFTVLHSRDTRGATALSAGAGYSFGRLALEAAYVDLGKIHEYTAAFTQGANTGSNFRRWEASGWSVAAVGSLPFGDFALLAKAGVARLEGEYRTGTSIYSPPPPAGGTLISDTTTSGSGRATVPGFGLGAVYRVSDELRVRFMAERWRLKAGMFGEGNDLDRVDLYSLGATYSF